MTVVIVIAAVVGTIALAFALQWRRSERVLRSLSMSDRQFIADQLEPFTRLPLSTAEDEDAWRAARDAAFRQLGERVPEFRREVLPRFLPYFNDADIFRQQPGYRANQERYVVKFIHEMRAAEKA